MGAGVSAGLALQSCQKPPQQCFYYFILYLLHVCICMCVCARVCACTCLRAHVCMHVCVCIHACVIALMWRLKGGVWFFPFTR